MSTDARTSQIRENHWRNSRYTDQERKMKNADSYICYQYR